MQQRGLSNLVFASVVWVIVLPASWGYAQTCSERIAQPSYGIGIDMKGNVWVPQHFSGLLREYDADGDEVIGSPYTMPGTYNRGVAVTPVDNHIWVAHTGFAETDNRVTRYDANTGDLCEVINVVGYGPSALAVDADGNVWVTNMGTAAAGQPRFPAIARITPADAGSLPSPCGTGSSASVVNTSYEIDTLEGGEDHPDGDAKPYNYSDMTGMVTLMTSATGTWTTIHDGGVYDAPWTMVTWTGHPSGTQPPGTSLAVAVRAADSEVGLASATYQEGIINGGGFVDVWGRYIQVRVRFRGTCPGTPFESPVLSDLQVTGSDVRDCNHNNIDDSTDVAAPNSDCNGNLVPDECEIDRNSEAFGTFFCRGLCDPDCNDNGIPDACDVDPSDPDGNGNSSADCNDNFIPDECEPDCQPNSIPDDCDIDQADPDENGVSSEDCDGNGVPDECDPPSSGACCTGEDMCEDNRKKNCCEAEGGYFLGEGTSCAADVCTMGACCDSLGGCTESDPTACTATSGSFLGYGTMCDPNCCPQTETGDDWCDLAVATPLTLRNSCHDDFGSPLENPKVPCDPANGDADCDESLSETCDQAFYLPSSVSLTGNSSTATAGDCISLVGERVWWESFVVDDCEGCDDCADCDNCGVVKMSFDCTDPPVTTFHTVVYEDCACGLGIRADVIDVGGGNPSLTWSLLAGTYYYPILADDNGISGPYQIHIETTRCNLAACCRQDACTIENKPDCDALDGDWLGYGDQPTVQCLTAPCSIGLCCEDSGICNDDEFHDTESECLGQGSPGTYHGGVSCLDFTCPGPIMCDVSSGNQCKEPDGDLLVISDFGACMRVADDFFPVGSSSLIDKICWRGAYHDFGGEPAGVTQISTILEPSNFVDCSGAYGDDSFTITIYDEVDGQPGPVKTSQSFDTAGGGLTVTPVDGGPIYDYSVTLSPALDIPPNKPYWLEIQNDNGGNDSCYWMWESSRQAFNSVSARDVDNNWEIGDVQISADQSMCLGGPDLELDPFDGTVITGACCFDGTGQCLDLTKYECDGVFKTGVFCSSDPCKFACCRPNGSCNDETASACAVPGEQIGPGVYSPGVRCADGPVCAQACAQGTRCCYDVDASPGCGDPSCCTTVCAFDPYCCETEWDHVCVEEASDGCAPNQFDECVASPILAAEPHDILKNRYISIDPRGAMGTNPPNLHIRVMVDSSLVNGQVGNGPWWANDPVDGAGLSPAVCISVVTTTKPASEPDWTGCNTVHLTGCPIIPTTTYAIVAESEGGTSSVALLDTQAKPGVKWYGDCVGFFDGVVWTPPNGTTSVDDAVAGIKTFQDANAFNATHVSVTDVQPNLNGEQINRIVNIGDVFSIILGFQGQEYPGSDLTQCP